MRATADMIHKDITMICTMTHDFLKNLLQRKETQHDVLYWIGICIHMNRPRGKVCYLGIARISRAAKLQKKGIVTECIFCVCSIAF